jgi:hypothetical protein
MNIDGNGTRNELARADATGHMRVAEGHASVPGRAESGGDCCVLPVPIDSGIIPVLFLPFSLPFSHPPPCPPRHDRRHSQEKEDRCPRLPLSW